MKQEEVSMVDEILSTPQGRAAMRMADQNSDLHHLLDIANDLITYAENIADESCGGDEEWMRGFHRFKEGYAEALKQR